MKVLVIGGGGREHAIIQKLKENARITELFALPGNYGMADAAQCVNIAATDIEGITQWARQNNPDFAVVTPDDPLALGCVDALEAIGIPCFGPNKAAAQIEASKVFAKNLMKKYHIPTADYAVFEDVESAKEYIRANKRYPVVIKADGLALGKGVSIACDEAQAMDALHAAMEQKVFGESGARVVIEEYLEGPEVSVLAFTDSKTLVPMVSSMDHKRALDGDEGPNTGGMGTVAPNPYYTPQAAQRCMEEIFLPTMKAMNLEGCPFKGCLYFGLMLTKDGPKVIEYNCRFGDPETQVVLPLLESDLLDIFMAVRNETLREDMVRFSDKSACCVVKASAGYPKKYESGFPIHASRLPANCAVFYAGVKADESGAAVTAGGRVLGITAIGEDLKAAVQSAYQAAECIRFENEYMRTDIGKKALEVLK
ncbi:MAG: phosphoribosylamine--glycine ligase [Clostridia bacterium]|nr:phosphoribosylamine--glycine ligase [Clostridia bacterium]